MLALAICVAGMSLAVLEISAAQEPHSFEDAIEAIQRATSEPPVPPPVLDVVITNAMQTLMDQAQAPQEYGALSARCAAHQAESMIRAVNELANKDHPQQAVFQDLRASLTTLLSQ